jgi:hypothetical protein
VTVSALSVWLLAIGGVATAAAVLGEPPRPRGVTFANPLSRRSRLLWASGAGGAIVVGVGGLVALIPDDVGEVSRVWAVPAPLLLLVILVYMIDVALLHRDRRFLARKYSEGNPNWPRIRSQQPLSWSLLHPLYDDAANARRRAAALE